MCEKHMTTENRVDVVQLASLVIRVRGNARSKRERGLRSESLYISNVAALSLSDIPPSVLC